jgi:hypothetical protein
MNKRIRKTIIRIVNAFEEGDYNLVDSLSKKLDYLKESHFGRIMDKMIDGQN